MNKRALLIVFYFPPVVGTSGVHRGYSLARYLPEFDWEPIILTARPWVHRAINWDQSSQLSPDLKVYRCLALDAARHMSIAGAYPDFFAWPDRWVSWYPAAVVRALRLIRKYKPQVIWSTCPIVTTQLIAMKAAKSTGLPWISDLRDSMTDESYPPAGIRRNIIRRIERKTVERADRVVFTAPGTLKMYAERYPDLPHSRWHLTLNGFDEEMFSRAEPLVREKVGTKTIILHSGVIYPQERDPSHLFKAIAHLKDRGDISDETCEIRLRASGNDELFKPELERLDIDRIVKLVPSVGYEEALAEMMSVDGLLLLQAANCNHQIPAKLYEYVRAKRPIIALTDKDGDTAGLLLKFGGADVAPLDSSDEIATTLLHFLNRIRDGVFDVDNDLVANYSRRSQARRTAALFDTVLNDSKASAARKA